MRGPNGGLEKGPAFRVDPDAGSAFDFTPQHLQLWH